MEDTYQLYSVAGALFVYGIELVERLRCLYNMSTI